MYCVHMCTEHVDVNITPDKRQLILHGEKALLLLVKVSVVSCSCGPSHAPARQGVLYLSNDFLAQTQRVHRLCNIVM